LVGRYPT